MRAICRLLACLLITLSAGTFAWAGTESCDCSLGTLALFDLDVRVPRPTDPYAIQRYFDLFDLGRFVRSRVMADRSCPSLQYLDPRVSGGNLRPAVETASPAPPGPLSYDYVLAGEITESEGEYTAVARLEAGKTREVIQAASYTFPDPGRGNRMTAWHDAVDALAAQLTPAAMVITRWEKKKRDSDPGIARANPEGKLILKPAKTQLNEGESTDVDLEMKDCDGTPLGQRKIHFEPGSYDVLGRLDGTTNGTVEPSEVITDEAGMAHVTYKASQQRGAAEIHAWYGHHRPRGEAYAITGNCTVNVGRPTLAFRTVLNLNMHNSQIEHTEEHHVEITYRSNCTGALAPGQKCTLTSSSLHASATSQWPKGSHSATLNDEQVIAEIVGRPGGATLTWGWAFAGMSPDEDDEHYIGVCSAEDWQPDHVDLSEQEMKNFASLNKMIPIQTRGDRNGCPGSGTIILMGQP